MGNSLNGSFDELVAGISAEERKKLLNKLNQNKTDILPVLHSQIIEEVRPLEVSLKSESIFYRIILWIKSFFTRKEVSELYNDDLISDLARKINKSHPGTFMHSHNLILSTFYERLKELKATQEFFAPYFTYVSENPASFYIFLSLFISPQISEKITKEADPYSLPFTTNNSIETRNSLLRSLTNVLNNLGSAEKNSLYEGIRTLSWLWQFTTMPLIHFLAQFTTIISDRPTCPYANARVDFDAVAKIMGNACPITNEILEALYLFPYRTSSHGINIDADTERSLNDFLKKSATQIAGINSFIQAVPVNNFGKVINDDYQWQVENFGGLEDWFSKFKEEWKKIFNERWQSWLRDKKKEELKSTLKMQFNIDSFPELENRPWQTLWGGLTFHCELTAGFLGWYVTQKFDETIWPVNAILMEGVFVNNENRTELSQCFNELQESVFTMKSFVESLKSDGSIGAIFEKVQSEHSRSMKNQNQINKLMMNAESTVRDSSKIFCTSCTNIERILHACLDDEKISGYEPIQNFQQIKGRENQNFKDELVKARKELITCKNILSEIEPLDLPQNTHKK